MFLYFKVNNMFVLQTKMQGAFVSRLLVQRYDSLQTKIPYTGAIVAPI